MKKFILALFVSSLSLGAFAASAAGKWNGKVKLDLSAVKARIKKDSAKMTGAQKSKADSDIAQATTREKVFAAATVSIDLRKDGSVTILTSINGKPESDTGKWKQTGNAVKFYGLSGKNGGPATMEGTLDAKGKNLVFDLSEEMKRQAKKKGVPAPEGVKFFISYTRA
jgi:hypothetical protein